MQKKNNEKRNTNWKNHTTVRGWQNFMLRFSIELFLIMVWQMRCQTLIVAAVVVIQIVVRIHRRCTMRQRWHHVVRVVGGHHHLWVVPPRKMWDAEFGPSSMVRRWMVSRWFGPSMIWSSMVTVVMATWGWTHFFVVGMNEWRGRHRVLESPGLRQTCRHRLHWHLRGIIMIRRVARVVVILCVIQHAHGLRQTRDALLCTVLPPGSRRAPNMGVPVVSCCRIGTWGWQIIQIFSLLQRGKWGKRIVFVLIREELEKRIVFLALHTIAGSTWRCWKTVVGRSHRNVQQVKNRIPLHFLCFSCFNLSCSSSWSYFTKTPQKTLFFV